MYWEDVKARLYQVLAAVIALASLILLTQLASRSVIHEAQIQNTQCIGAFGVSKVIFLAISVSRDYAIDAKKGIKLP